MGWTDSRVFGQFLEDSLNNDAAFDLAADGLKAALFNNTPTPDKDASAANSAYGAGQWASGGVSDASGWPAAGRSLASVTSLAAAGHHILDAADTVSANSTTTLANAYGTLIYDDTLAAPVADQGICFNYFGGANSVTSGTFTVVWNVSGIMDIAY